jgi:hypothetical protein
MGLLKTAMISGAAMYGVKQISKEAGRHYNQQSDARRMVPMAPMAPYSRDQPSSGYEDGEEYYEQAPPPPSRNAQWRMISDQPAQYEQADFDRDNNRRQQRRQQQPTQFRGPAPEYYVEPQQGRRVPQYSDSAWDYSGAPQQIRSGFVEPYEVEEPVEPRSSSNNRNALLSQAVRYAQTYGPSLMERRNSKSDGNGTNVQEFISGLIRK